MQDLVEKLSIQLAEREWKIALAESCTGGLLAAAITHRPGSSAIFERGYVTYSNAAKSECLDVPEEMIKKNGAVSAEVAEAMATGALAKTPADMAVSITGVAGPDGGSEAKPVGLVYFGYALKNGSSGSVEYKFDGTREQIRAQAATTALKHMLTVLERDR